MVTDRASGPSVRRLAVHSALLWLLLLALMPIAAIDRGFVSPDEGILTLGMKNLDLQGSLRTDYPLADLDPEGVFVPLNPTRYMNGEMVTYPSRPAYVQLNRRLTMAAGRWGPSAFGALVVAAAGLLVGLTAREIQPGVAVGALWFCGVGTPLLFNGYVLQGNVIGALAGAIVSYLAIRSRRDSLRTRVMAGALAAAVIASGCLVRRETIFLSIAVLAWSLWRTTRHRDSTALQLGTGVAVGGALGLGLERALMREAFGSLDSIHVPVLGQGPSLLVGRVLATRESLFLPSFDNREILNLMALVGLALVIVGSAWLRARPQIAVLIAGLSLVGLPPMVRLAGDTEAVAMIPGLMLTSPVLIAGLFLVPGTYARRRDGECLIVVTALVVGAVLATQYGSGWDWGGRFFSLAIPSSTVLAALGWHSVLERLPHHRGAALTVAAMTSVLVLAFVALAVQRDNRLTTSDLVEAIVSHADEQTILASGPIWLPRFDVEQLAAPYAWARVRLSDLPAFTQRVREHPEWRRVITIIGRDDGPPLDDDTWGLTGPWELPTINPPLELWILDRRD